MNVLFYIWKHNLFLLHCIASIHSEKAGTKFGKVRMDPTFGLEMDRSFCVAWYKAANIELISGKLHIMKNNEKKWTNDSVAKLIRA